MFFKNLVFGAIDYREKNNIEIHDMINLLMQVRKNLGIKSEDEDKHNDAGFATVEESEVLTKSANKISSKA